MVSSGGGGGGGGGGGYRNGGLQSGYVAACSLILGISTQVL